MRSESGKHNEERRRRKKNMSVGEMVWKEEKGRKVEEKEVEEKEKEKVQGNEVVEEVQEVGESLFAKNAGENKKEKAGRWKCRQPKVRWTLAKFGKWLFIVLMIGQSLVACSIG